MNGFRSTFGFLVSAFFAVAFLFINVQGCIDELRLAMVGADGHGLVTRTSYESKLDEAYVRLQPPAPQVEGKLLDRKGDPPVGATWDVTYLPSRPGLVRQKGALPLWNTLVPALLASVMGAVAIDSARHLWRNRAA